MDKKISREEAIIKFRKMWKYMGEEGFKRKEKISKLEAIQYLFPEDKEIKNKCYLCEYAFPNCKNCPIDWNIYSNNEGCNICPCEKSLYEDWIISLNFDWKSVAKIALEIAKLPEKKEKGVDKNE